MPINLKVCLNMSFCHPNALLSFKTMPKIPPRIFFLEYATRNYLNLNGKIKHWKRQIHLQLQKTKECFPDI